MRSRNRCSCALGIVFLFLFAVPALPAPEDGEQRKQELDLISAARFGKVEAVKELIGAGVDVDATDADGLTALRWAAVEGWTRVVTTLLEAGADPNAADRDGVTALMMACRWAYMDSANALVATGAEMDRLSTIGPGRTALMYAAIGGYRGLVQFLVEAGADPSIEDSEGRTAAELAALWGQKGTAEFLHDR